MPADRFIHPRCGHSEKVSSLTDLEFRVWTQYIMTADDFGVMRLSALTLQAANDSLAARPAKMIQRCLDRLVSVGLVVGFEHQGRTYCYQPTWHDYQKVRYPRPTHEPTPSPEDLAKCSDETRKLFAMKIRKDAESDPKDSGKVSEIFPHPARTGARERLTATANAEGSRQTAETRGSSALAPKPLDLAREDALAERAGRLCERYAEMHAKFRNGARYISRPNLDYTEALQLVGVWDDERLDKLAQAFLQTDDEWVASGSRTMARFRSRASWCDDRLREKGL